MLSKNTKQNSRLQEVELHRVQARDISSNAQYFYHLIWQLKAGQVAGG